jgi:NodT family efflux transporter outer membrane factor (OMF) lipoprotein
MTKPGETSMNLSTVCLALVATGSLVGCMVGPNYRPPETRAPQQWSEPMAGGETSRAADLALWWQGFRDPELDSLETRALGANLDLRQAQARVRQARAQRGLAGAALAPTLDASGSASREKQSGNQPLLGGLLPPGTPLTSNAYQTGFDASWELDLFGGARRGTEAADAALAAAGYSLADAQVSLVAEVARNYVAARGYQQRLAIALENLAAQRDIVALAQSRYRQGFTSSLEPDQAATVLAQTESQVPALETGLQTAVHHLGVLLGQDPGALRQELAASAAIPGTPAEVPAGLPADLVRRRPDIRVAERRLAEASARVGVAKADLYPRFALTGSFGWDSARSGSLFTPASSAWSWGPAFRWPVFDAGKVRANVRVQDARQEEALAFYQKAVLTGFEDVENALVAYAKEQARNIPLRAAVASSSSALEVARQQYGSGLTSFINVLDAERTVYQAQDTLVQSDQAVALDLIALCKALGGGWPAPGPGKG